MFTADGWKDYEILETGNGEKIERWGKYVLRRPDPQIIWGNPGALDKIKVDGHYHRSSKGGGQWEFFTKLPEKWIIEYKDLKFYVRPTGFKHTGLFPEQAANWDFIKESVKKRPGCKVLNLFAYTGGATLAAASAGADVVHVDASKGMLTWARENLELSGLGDKYVRFLADDCEKFVQREIRRGNKYDGIIMDPPSYGRGPGGELWKMEDKIFGLAELCTQILKDKPLFFIINSYTTGLSPSVTGNILKLTAQKKFGGHTRADEVGLPAKGGIYLPCGSTGRWSEE